ncbi:methyltransferase domain-containing protein [Candidatus Thorarchaeota archaeon]|nr:MAG: methyltransferase domain-containing protein [Candidatus Thorarchaeota archaeon]
MDEPHLRALRCPECGKKFQPYSSLTQGEDMKDGQIICERGHSWSVKDGIPTLVYPRPSKEDAKWIQEYDKMAESYDELVKQYNDWLGIDMMKERERFSVFIPIEGPCKILDVSIGTAANFVALGNKFKHQMGRFNLHGMDLSKEMLNVAKKKTDSLGLHVSLTHGSVFNIPYQSNFFDIVLHSGGINTFSDIHGALSEMLRVVRSHGVVLVIDEGLSPKKRGSEEGKEIIKTNSLFASRPPLQFIPEQARNVEISYIMNDTFYQMVFTK